MSTGGPTFPIVIGTTGLQPQSPTFLLNTLLTIAQAESPGLTADLPGILIEDISSTEVAGIAICDQAKVETVNSLAPLGTNEFLLGQLGQVYIGESQPGKITNTQVNVVFSGTVNFVVNQGFLVSDGTYTYQTQTATVIASGGSSAAVSALATISGSWAVAANSVTTLKTVAPPGITLSVNNPNTGVPGGAQETWQSFQARILQAGLAACCGTARFIKTLLALVPNVALNTIAVQQSTPGLRIIVAGGDPSAIALAIFQGVGDPSTLVGSAVSGSRNQTTSLNDYPDTYNILSVQPVQQTVTLSVTWNTIQTNFTGGDAFPGLVQAPLAAYINAIGTGQPINILELNNIFQTAVAGLLPPALLTSLSFSVYLNGSGSPTPPTSGTFAVPGDPEGYFYILQTGITVTQS